MQRLPGKWLGAGRAGNSRSIGGPYVDKGKLRALLKDPLARITQLKQKPAKNNDKFTAGHCNLKGHLSKVGMVDSP